MKKIKLFLLPKDIADNKNAIIEIRAGTIDLKLVICIVYINEKVSQKKWVIEIISFQKVMLVDLKK